jgi:Tfp pilus assembly protein PilZ
LLLKLLKKKKSNNSSNEDSDDENGLVMFAIYIKFFKNWWIIVKENLWTIMLNFLKIPNEIPKELIKKNLNLINLNFLSCIFSFFIFFKKAASKKSDALQTECCFIVLQRILSRLGLKEGQNCLNIKIKIETILPLILAQEHF